MSYDSETKWAYDAEKAKDYKEEQTKRFCWARFTSSRQTSIVGGLLGLCGLKRGKFILDIPCGTGILGKLLSRLDCSIVASDISLSMMELARGTYRGAHFAGMVRADVLEPPFMEGAVECVIVLGLMHRLPATLRNEILRQVVYVSSRFVIVSYSIDGLLQRCKRRILGACWRSYKPAPSPAEIEEILREFGSNSLRIIRRTWVAPFLSSEIVFLLEKN